MKLEPIIQSEVSQREKQTKVTANQKPRNSEMDSHLYSLNQQIFNYYLI